MNRLIVADALIEALRAEEYKTVKHPTFLRSELEEGFSRGINIAKETIMIAPTIEAEPVRRGRWLPHPTEKDWRVCSACGQGTEIVRHEAGATTEYSYKHCPWCGARMEVEND